MDKLSGDAPKEQQGFPATRWTIVLAANDSDNPQAHEALNQLCKAYWYPLYAFVRRRGHDSHGAQDLTQAFFERLFETGALAKVKSERGKFRTFLLTSLTHFLNSQWEREGRLKRGGGREFISWDVSLAESQFVAESAQFGDVARSFDYDWAKTLVAKVMSQLQHEYAAGIKQEVFSELSRHLTHVPSSDSLDETPARTDSERNAFNVALHRLRKRFGEMLRSEISETVSRPEDVDDELRNLLASLGT